jgi:hypothetical protein
MYSATGPIDRQQAGDETPLRRDEADNNGHPAQGAAAILFR